MSQCPSSTRKFPSTSSAKRMANLLLGKRRANLDISADALHERQISPTMHEYPVYSESISRYTQVFALMLSDDRLSLHQNHIHPLDGFWSFVNVFNEVFTADRIDKERRKFDQDEAALPDVPRDWRDVLTGPRILCVNAN